MDRFRVEVIAKTPNPQQVVYAAMHQDYSDGFVYDERDSWPSESQSGEIIVRRLLAGDRGHYGCYTPDTEVLTRRGWVKFPNLLPQEEVVAVNIQTGQGHFESPIAYQKHTINDKIYQVKGQNLSLAVTLDHRMVVAHRQKGGSWTDYYFASAADVAGKPRKYLNSTCLKFDQRCSYPPDLPPGYDPEKLMKLAGFFIGDGCINNASIYTRFRLRKQNKIDYLYGLGFEIKEHPNERYSLTDSKVAAWLQQTFTQNQEKFIPWSCLNLTPDLIACLLEGMRVTDGTEKSSTWSYDSTSDQVLDFLQAILHLNGESGSYSLNNPNQGEEHKNHKPCGRIHISKRREPRVEISQNNRSRSYVESIESYQGDVFCVTVSTGALLVRKDRKVVVCGNCLEHPQIVFNCGYFPHSVMQQARTHRVGVSFDVQCLSADTEITFVNCEGDTSQKLKKTIGELYDIWTNGEKAIRQRSIRGRNGEAPGQYRRDCKQRIRKMRLRVLNEETGLFEVGHIKDVMCSGLQPVYRVTLEDGKTLDCTVNHRLFTSEGWQTMGDAVGLVTNIDGTVIEMTKPSYLMCNGIAVLGKELYRNREWLESQIEKGLSTLEIAELSQCSINTVRTWAGKYGLSLNQKDGKFTKQQKPWNYNPNALYRDQVWLEEQLSQGLHVDEMAELANCSIEAIKKWVYTYGLSLNKRSPGSKTPWNKNNGGYHLNLSEESRQKRIDNAKRYTKRGEESNFWKGGTSTERELIGAWTRDIAPKVHEKFNYICQKCRVRGGILHAHHLIPVYADESVAYDFDNLVTLCKECHEYVHQNNQESEFAKAYDPILDTENWQTKPKPLGKKLQSHPVKVKSVEYLGQQMTYDLEVEGSWHNFVANGIVVHNSFRYTGNQFIDVVEGKKDIEDVFYLRPVGDYADRQGKKYFYSPEQRAADLAWCLEAAKRYKADFEGGMSEEHARGKVPFDYRQHFVVSFNLRSFMHFCDMRNKKDAQLEIQQLCELMWPHFAEWTPAIAQWYEKQRQGKARLAP